MSDRDQLRAELAGLRRALAEQRNEAMLAREALRRAEGALKAFGRAATPDDEAAREQLAAAVATAQARVERLGGALGELGASEARVAAAYHRASDPRETLRGLRDDTPILLFPLRLETRFKTSAEGRPQLWVRVYPDTCLVDSFEPALTEDEVRNARVFWAAVWRACGDEALERAAWRELVAAHGSGRAAWVIREYAPLNPADKPTRATPPDVVLIIVAPGPLPGAVTTYWAAAWRASGDPAAVGAARAALDAAVGADQAAAFVAQTQPFNFADAPVAPATHADAPLTVAVLQLAPPEELALRRGAWSSAPRVELLPDRFVLVGYEGAGASLVEVGAPIRTPLLVGPDPHAPPQEQLKPDGDGLQIPDELAWMFDFEVALKAGMAFRCDLTPAQASAGFRRLVVLGVRLADTPAEGQAQLERLLEHHLHSRGGLELLPQGTPTNNTEAGGAGYAFRDDSDATFVLFVRGQPAYTPTPDPLLRPDGQRLAELLGLRRAFTQRIPNGGLTDASEAQAMQIALWPGTLGYMLDTQLAPVFTAPQIAATRAFFTRYVRGRGPLPALRIGVQPYGILPVTAFDRVNWFGANEREPFPRQLYTLLRRVEDDWRPLVERVSFVGKRGGDPHQILLDVLGLHPASAEYYPLQADSVEHKFYELAFFDFSVALGFLGLFPVVLPLALLRSLGYTGDEVPELLSKVYHARQRPLDGPIIDDRPLSERDPIRAYAAGRNYIAWLVEAAQSGIAAVQEERGFDGDKKPEALLYLLLRHALQLGFYETGVRLQAAVEEAATLRAPAREPAFIHIAEARGGSESRYSRLFRADERVTGRPDLLLGDHIARNIRAVDPELREQIEALERLSRLPTARLERLFAEHIDTCSYRLDAWKTGLLTFQLERLRGRFDGDDVEVKDEGAGLLLGAYGWVEALRPEGKVLTPVELPDDLAVAVNRGETAPLLRDSGNHGLIHAPSLNHATTAAVLRNGYIANDGRLAVNLSSRRVRLALAILEGMRGGQSLGALLGYQMERHVHDHGPLEVRALIYPLRRAFPLAADQIAKTRSDEGEAREALAAMHVVDGRKLIEHVERTGQGVYPFGLDLPRVGADRERALSDAVAHIRDVNDAVADLVLAEGVHQAVLGNYERSAGTLDAFAKGAYPPEPEVVRTPRSGIALTMRVAIHLPPAPPANPLPTLALTPLAAAEPAVNAWLAGRLPAPADVGCQVSFVDRATDAEQTVFISQDDLDLQPIDLVYRVQARPEQALGDLDERLLAHVHTAHTPRHDRPIRLRYTERVPGKVGWFELQALLQSLRALVAAGRPLQPADLMRANDATSAAQSAVTLDRARVTTPAEALRTTHLPALDTLETALNDATVVIDAAIAQFAATVGALAAYRLPGAGTGFAFEWRAATYTALTTRIAARLNVWDERLASFDDQLADYDALPAATPEDERVALLRAAEILISSELTTAADAAAHRLALDGRRTAFVTRRDDLRDLVDTPRATLTALLDDTAVALPLTAFDPEPFDLAAEIAEVARFRGELLAAVAALRADVTRRLARADDLLARQATAAPAEGVRLLQEAAAAIFGEDVQLVPRIALPATAAAELANAWAHSTSGELTRHLTDTVGRDFPVDDWLHGVARVRDKLHHWENVLLLGEALEVGAPGDLTPLQLPHGAGEPWLALEIPNGYTITDERLLYTAHFAEPFDPSAPVCGLLVDEWTEVIPGAEETTGVAFHYDRPNSEPPQAWLLALPAVRDGFWSWDELLGAVNDALDTAKLRALEPVHLDATPYSAFLPATLSAYTFPEISISNNLLRNLRIYARLVREEGP